MWSGFTWLSGALLRLILCNFRYHKMLGRVPAQLLASQDCFFLYLVYKLVFEVKMYHAQRDSAICPMDLNPESPDYEPEMFSSSPCC